MAYGSKGKPLIIKFCKLYLGDCSAGNNGCYKWGMWTMYRESVQYGDRLSKVVGPNILL